MQTNAEVGMPTRNPIMFHASQALFLLMDKISVKARWLQVFLGERTILTQYWAILIRHILLAHLFG